MESGICHRHSTSLSSLQWERSDVNPSQAGGARAPPGPLQGQQLLDELEEELRALDEEAEGGGGIGGWVSEYEGVLAKMDRLQSGYQVEMDRSRSKAER